MRHKHRKKRINRSIVQLRRKLIIFTIFCIIVLIFVFGSFFCPVNITFSLSSGAVTTSATNKKDSLNRQDIIIHNSSKLDDYLGEKTISLEDISIILNSNTGIHQAYKDIIYHFSEKIVEAYPNLDLRMFYENLKTLEIHFKESEFFTNRGTTATAIYNWDENAIYLSKNINIFNNVQDRIVFFHELCHVITLGTIRTVHGKTVKKEYSYYDEWYGYGNMINEAITVALTYYAFQDEFGDDNVEWGYGIISNELIALINTVPEFDMSILANQGIYATEKYFDECFHTSITARELFIDMELQCYGYYNYGKQTPEVLISFDDKYYDSIYKYIAEVYRKNVLSPDMSYEEIKRILNDLIVLLKRNIDDYPREEEYYKLIEDAFEGYAKENGIALE